jgi:hypothetical protein
MSNSAHANQATLPSKLVDSPFLNSIRIETGPRDILGRFFLKADTDARARGLSLAFMDLEQMAAINSANSESWRPLLSHFNVANGGISSDNGFCVVARDAQGKAVACHAARRLDWQTTSVHDEMTSLRLFYARPDSMKRPGEECIVSAPSTQTFCGRLIFSGAAWVHPQWRGTGVTTLLPRIGKACAMARWPFDSIISVMAEDVYARGFAPRFGYTHIDWDIRLLNSALGDLRLAFLAMTKDDAERYLVDYLARSAPQIDGVVLRRGA